MAFAYVIVALISAAVAVFALQNNQPMPLRFLTWSTESVPLAGALLLALAAGLLLAGAPLAIARWRARSRVRALERRVEILETALGERDVPAMAPRPAVVPRDPPARTA